MGIGYEDVKALNPGTIRPSSEAICTQPYIVYFYR